MAAVFARGESLIEGAAREPRLPISPIVSPGWARGSRASATEHLKGDTALVTGVDDLRGAQVMATDLRASVSLIIAGLAAQGETMIGRVYHLDRGFERIEDKLRQCGAQIERLAG